MIRLKQRRSRMSAIFHTACALVAMAAESLRLLLGWGPVTRACLGEPTNPSDLTLQEFVQASESTELFIPTAPRRIQGFGVPVSLASGQSAALRVSGLYNQIICHCKELSGNATWSGVECAGKSLPRQPL
ncbi:hypothetical protein BJX70DRAFT_127946 [Aspergillus crustosus]